MAELRQNTWTLDQWYAQKVAGNVSYTGVDSLFAWGKNYAGLLGQNNQTQYSSPVQIPGTTWQYLSHTSGSNDTSHVFSTRTDGTLWTWGWNNKGQLGLNSQTSYSSPIQIPGEWDGKNMIVSGQSSFGIKTDGTLWAWGANQSGYGRLGLNNKTSYSSPVQIPGTTWSKINANGFATMATKTDGTLWTWGNGNVGQLAQNNQTNYSSPKQVPGTTWATSMSGGSNWQTAIKTDGTLWVWGYNQNGQLGQGEVGTGAGGLGGAKSSPIQVGSDTTWSKIISTNTGAAAIKTDGTLWVWGSNQYGLLGQNQAPAQLAAISSPTQITGTTWANVHTNKSGIIAVKTDATMWSWGYNSNGQLGIDNTTAYSSPTQIAGDWKQGVGQIGSTEFGFMALKDL